ncbi:sugar ABC transporter permease [Litorilinea aerophila]|nr:sugar ABC transporter permease [Litorilinea aerophila]MCC9077141.1 sugar ABC transporter permease [Litorilinea aerophila]
MSSTFPMAHRRTSFDNLKKRLRQSLPWYPFILINIVIFFVFNLIPWISMIETSFYDTDLLSSKEFVGLGNLVRMVTDPQLHRAVLNTFYFTLMYIPLLVVISLFVAILVNRPLFGMRFFRALYFLPNVTSIAVLSLVFRRFLSPRPDAPINFLLGQVGIPPQKFLIDVHQAMPSIVAISLWEAFGYFMVIWLAGLQGIPTEMYDAARVDGAEGWKLHRYVTLPLLRPTAAFIIIVATIGALQVFGSIFILTGGGPVYATTTVVYYIYSQAFNFGRFGYASSLSILFFIIILIITLIQSRFLRFGEEVY